MELMAVIYLFFLQQILLQQDLPSKEVLCLYVCVYVFIQFRETDRN